MRVGELLGGQLYLMLLNGQVEALPGIPPDDVLAIASGRRYVWIGAAHARYAYDVLVAATNAWQNAYVDYGGRTIPQGHLLVPGWNNPPVIVRFYEHVVGPEPSDTVESQHGQYELVGPPLYPTVILVVVDGARFVALWTPEPWTSLHVQGVLSAEFERRLPPQFP
ncbi:MAG: hypothetical protein ACR2RB_00895 [Gammaproteobacteria bacterium]